MSGPNASRLGDREQPLSRSVSTPIDEPRYFRCACCALVAATLLAYLSGCYDANSSPARPLGDAVSADSQLSRPSTSSREHLRSIADIAVMATEFDRRAALYALLQTASVDDIRGLLDDTEAVLPASKRLSLKYVIYSRFGAVDGMSAVDRARHDNDGAQALFWTFIAWAEADLEATVSHAQSMSRRDRRVAYQALLSMHHDVAHGLAKKYAEQLSVSRFSQEPNRLYVLALENPQRAWAQAIATPTPNKRNLHLWDVAKAWIQVDPRAAMEAVESARGIRMPVHWRHALLDDWAAVSPNEALDWVMSRSPSKATTTMLGVVLGAIASTTPQDALAIANTLSGLARDAAYQRVLEVWAEQDPRSAAVWFNTSADFAQSDVAVGIARRFARKHPDEALDWALTLGEIHRVRTTKSVIDSLVDDNPTEAAQLVLRIEEPVLQIEATTVLLRSWVAADPASATRWIAGLQDKTARLFAYNAAFRMWGQSDFSSAANSADSVIGLEERHEAVGAVLRSLDVRDPPDFRLLKRLHNSLPKNLSVPAVVSYLNEKER